MQFTIWLTTGCNMNCSYCYEGTSKIDSYMDLTTANQTLKFIKKQMEKHTYGKDDFDSIVFHGGEPLLNYKLIEYFVEEIKSWKTQRTLFMSLTTNGTLLTKSRLDFLLNELDGLSISIDGNKRVHDMNRRDKNGRGTFDVVLCNIKDALKESGHKCDLNARMTVTLDNYNSLYESINYLNSIGFNRITPVLDNYSNWDKEQIERLFQIYVKVYEDFCIGRGIKIGGYDAIRARMGSKCMAGEETMHINPKGVIFPCGYLINDYSFKLGDVFDGIINDKVEELRRINNLSPTFCYECAWSENCIATRCKLINYSMTGDYCHPTKSVCLGEQLQLRLYGYLNKLNLI